MASGGVVRVLSVTHVRPAETETSKSNLHDHTTIKLSLFDTLSIPLRPIQLLFFYDGGNDDLPLPPFPALLSTLRSSLAASLAVFTPLAGNLAVSKSSGGDDDILVIDCSPTTVSQGVRFVEAEYAGTADDVRRLAGAAEHDAEAYARLVPDLAVSPLPVPVLAVQVTRPADTDGAVAVGVSVSHVVGDGLAVSGFMQAWAAAARGGSPTAALAGLIPFPQPVFDRAALFNAHPEAEAVARKLVRILAPALPTVNPFPGPDMAQQRRKTYLLSASQILALKQRIVSLQRKDANNDNNNNAAAPATTTVAMKKPPSTFAAVVSLVWTSIIRAKNTLHHAEDDDTYLAFPADCRARLRPPMPATFFGSCFKLCHGRATVGELRDGGAGDGALARAAAAVRDAVREQLEDPLGDVHRWLERHQALPPDRCVHIGSSNWFPAYEADFGWGRPSRAELVSVFASDFAALVGAPDGAVQVSVALDRERMDDFEANFLSQLHGSASA